MGLLSWIFFGLIAGAIAKLLHKGPDPGGWMVTILIGICGACIGGWIGRSLGWGDISGFNFKSFFMAVIGSLILLVIYRAFIGRTSS